MIYLDRIKPTLLWLSFVFVWLGGSVSTSADESPIIPLEIGIKASATWAKFGSFDDAAYDVGPSAGISASVHIYRWISGQPELWYVSRGSDVLSSTGDRVFASYDLHYVELPLLVRANLPAFSRVAPHVIIGPSLGIVLSARLTTEAATFDVLDGTNRLDLGLTAGAGFSLGLVSSLDLTFEGRYSHGLRNVFTGEESDAAKNRAIFLVAGVGWAFGKDSDRDGLADTKDRCPREAEDRDGHEDGDGCPDPDNDGDGVLDTSDRCIDEPEDKDAFEDDDGCPDPDNDRDGIPDQTDRCPNEPFARRPDGCVPVYESIVVTETSIALKEGKAILFELNKAAIRDEHKAILDDVAQALTDYPGLRVLVEGNADGEGTTKQNELKSQERADAVRDYLIKQKHVAADRLVAKGYGEERPRYQEETPEARRKNRRVEFSAILPR